MRLKSLKLAGFKSFANPATIHFKKDITAIVGPNGCGKSNVIDAIRWVLGESSAKQLRGGAMSDVIFAGSDGRPARAMASVELVLEHTQDSETGIRHALNLYQELSLRRQITSDGKSDYFINGQKVRRRDVIDVFLGTGLSSRSYAVIEQGMIGRIIDADGQKLREFIEEAAGVSRYQARRIETQKQLEMAKENLERLHDLQNELTAQKDELQQQAQSAIAFEALSEQLQQIEADLLIQRLYDAWQTYTNSKRQSDDKQAYHTQLMTTLATLEQTKQQYERHFDELRWLKDTTTNAHHANKLQEQNAKHALTDAKSRQQNTQEQLKHLNNELDILVSQLDDDGELMDTLAEHSQQVAILTQALDELDKTLITLKQSTQIADNDLKNEYRLTDGLKSDRQALLNAQAVIDSQLKQCCLSQARYAKQLSSDLPDKPSDDEKLLKLNQTLTALPPQIDILEQQLDAERAVMAQSEQQVKEQQNHLSELEKRYGLLSAEYNALHKVLHPVKVANNANNASNKAGSASIASQTATPPKIAEVITLSPLGKQYSECLDQVLGAILSDDVLSPTVPPSLCKHSGWYTKTANQSPAFERACPDGLLCFDELITHPKLALWSSLFLLKNLDGEDQAQADKMRVDNTTTDSDEDFTALSLKFKVKAAAFVRVDGVIIHPFGVKVMNDDKSQFLTTHAKQSERLEQLDEALGELEMLLDGQKQQLKQHQNTYHSQKISFDALNASYEQKKRELWQAQNQYNERFFAHKTRMQAFELAQQKHAQLQMANDELLAQMAQLTAQQSQNADKLALITAELAQQEQALDKQKQHHRHLQQRLFDSQNKKQALSLDLLHHKKGLETRQKDQQKLAEQLNTRKQALATLERQLASINDEIPVLDNAYQIASEQTKISEQKQQSVQEELAQMLAKFSPIKDSLAKTQQEAEHIAQQLSGLGADVAVALARLQDIGDKLKQNDDAFNLSYTLDNFLNNPPTHNITALVSQQKTISKQIATLGAVNLTAKEQLQALNERLLPMNEQMDDVKKSVAMLNDAIGVINQKTKKLFMTTLSVVNDTLNTLFAKVFEGGRASLSLIDDGTLSATDQWQAPLVLMAQPKGKKNSRLAILSGGEKTLTALSLIFAIFKQHPAPFCVLDEVDAPLDDANVARFTALIDELAHQVQFIFISHNKLAMQTAGELKGITMPQAGISSVVSVNLDEAWQMVE